MRSILTLLVPLSLLVACDQADTTESAEIEEATSCDFSTIAGTWTGVIPSGEHQTLSLEAEADYDASIGTNAFSSDEGEQYCSFDVTCKPSAAEGTFLVYNEILDGQCTEGWYTLTLADGALAVDYHLTEDGPAGSSYELTQE
jgi:major membrane immunogen (membrane-anchored lipoprotein)